MKKENEYKKILKIVNECIYKDEYINYKNIFFIRENYIYKNINLSKYEKIYLKNKLERAYESFLINISRGNISIFSYRKRSIEYEHIYRTIVAYKNNIYKKSKIKRNIIHLLNSNVELKNKSNINYIINIM